MRLTDRKIDSLVSIKPYSGLVNDKEKLTKWRNQVFLDNPNVDIQTHDKAATFQMKVSDASALILIDSDAREKLTPKNGNMSNTTNMDICASLIDYYGRAAK